MTNLKQFSEVKDLINLEVEKAMNNQKEKFKSVIDKPQERVTNLDHPMMS